MKTSPKPQSATTLARAPRDEAVTRSRRYLIMMAIRMACIIAMVLVTPYSWYTWLFAVGAIFLPYVAVVLANVGDDVSRKPVESPERALTAAPQSAPVIGDPVPPVIRIEETRAIPQPRDEAPGPNGAGAPR